VHFALFRARFCGLLRNQSAVAFRLRQQTIKRLTEAEHSWHILLVIK